MNNTNTTLYRTLILDAEFITSLTILRSLSRQGIHCDIASSTTQTICRSSRYAKTHFQYPDPLVKAEDFVDYICKLLEENEYDLVIPVTERSLIPLSESNKLDPWRDRLAIAERESLIQVLDKEKTLKLAKQYDVSTPFSQTISSIEEVQLLAEDLEYPVVLKPGQSIPEAEHRRQLTVSYAHNASELIQGCKDLLPFCQILLQQYATGVGTGIEILANQGEIVYSFQHLRLHELPLTGGGSCFRKSIPVDPILLEASEKLIAALKWHGVAMVEFKWQPESGKYWLMEINGRFWGSLPLANAAGADFPKMLFDLLVLKKLPETVEYKENIVCRKLSSDLNWLEQVLRKNEDASLVNYPDKLQILRDLAFFLHPSRHFLDIQSLSDPLPGLIDIYSITKDFSQRLYFLLLDKLILKYHASAFLQKRLLKRLNKAKTILFLCYGNINRSALAQVIAQEYLEDTNIELYSAGFHQHDKRPADPNMVKVAAENDIDLSNWQSVTLNQQLVTDADIIFVMEIQHLSRLFKSYPNTKNKSFLFGSLTTEQHPNPEISDPYNQDYSTFIRIFKRIQLATTEIKKSFIQNK